MALLVTSSSPGVMGKYRAYLRGAVNHKLSLTTLGSKVVVGSAIADVLTNKAWLSSVKATWTLKNLTESGTVGPILVGVCHSDYTDTQIEEWIEQTQSWETKSKLGQEIAKRMIRRVGVFRSPNIALGAAVLNEGRLVNTKCNWMLEIGQTLKVWAYNSGAGAVSTTVPDLRIEGVANLWPK